MRVVRTILGACLLWLATSAWASPFPVTFPELHANNIQVTSTLITGGIDTVKDYGLCAAGCHFGGSFSIDSSLLFQIYGTSPSDLYLTGAVVDATFSDPTDVSLLISVLFDDQSKWDALEGQPATPFGDLLAFNIRNVKIDDGGSNDDGKDDDNGHETDGDIGPPCTPTPEPASCVLVIGGIAAGILRRRLAA